MKTTLRLIRTGRIDVPYPEVYWMERFGDWTTLEFQMGIIRRGEKIILVNTGFPEDIRPLAEAWRTFLGPRAVLERPDEWKTATSLRALGVEPESVDFVVVTPIQLYTTGNLHLFTHAKIAVSRRGWIEDILAPTYPHHVPRQGCLSDDHLHWLIGGNCDNLLLLDDVHELVKGVTCRWAGVHHRSSMLVELETDRGLVILSDCAFHFANLEEGRPLGIAESIIEAHSVYADIRRRAAHFIPLYDPLVHQRYPDGIVI